MEVIAIILVISGVLRCTSRERKCTRNGTGYQLKTGQILSLEIPNDIVTRGEIHGLYFFTHYYRKESRIVWFTVYSCL